MIIGHMASMSVLLCYSVKRQCSQRLGAAMLYGFARRQHGVSKKNPRESARQHRIYTYRVCNNKIDFKIKTKHYFDFDVCLSFRRRNRPPSMRLSEN